MARFTPILGDLAGKLAGVVFARNRYGGYARQYVVPVNPNTQAQAVARANFGSASQAFHQLTDAQKALWQTFALNKFNPRNNVNNGQFSAQNAFVSCAMAVNSCQDHKSSFLISDGTTPITCPATDDFALSLVPPEEPLSANCVSQSTGTSFVPIIEDVTYRESGALNFTLACDHDASWDIGADGLEDSNGNNFGIAVFQSIAKKQVHNFTRGSAFQLIHANRMLSEDFPATLISDKLQFVIGALSNVGDYRLWPEEGEVVELKFYLVSPEGMVACLGSSSPVVDPAL